MPLMFVKPRVKHAHLPLSNPPHYFPEPIAVIILLSLLPRPLFRQGFTTSTKSKLQVQRYKREYPP